MVLSLGKRDEYPTFANIYDQQEEFCESVRVPKNKNDSKTSDIASIEDGEPPLSQYLID